jgi:hypothetical protein
MAEGLDVRKNGEWLIGEYYLRLIGKGRKNGRIGIEK